ncbi:MAG: hypothetical protein M1831_007426 [Alyxoria varia]|nr:MAG: hypothetical protein M1831_007426 [Alyxoria varia]
MDATATARALVHDDDLERFLDVYDVRNEDLQEASLGYTEENGEENTSLKNIRIHQARYATIRRLLLCCLLSQEATGRRSDAPRWQTVASIMDQLGTLTENLSKNLIKLLNEEERIPSPNGAVAGSPTSPLHKAKSSHTRLQSEVRRISTLSTGIRSLQAKIYLLREESTQALSAPTSDEELSSVSESLRDQYDALGDDVHALMQAWESGKQALNRDISSQSRIVSRRTSIDINQNAAKPLPHEYHDLASVEEGSNQSVARSASLMNGPSSLPLSPPSTEDGSSDPGADDEVFETISSPRQRERSTLTRAQRIAKMNEERERQVSVRENRDASSNMVKELQSVIKLRPVVGKKRESAARARVTSM